MEWNKLVLSELAPRAWATLLQDIVHRNLLGSQDVFKLWPRLQDKNAHGDAAYWKSILEGLVDAVILSQASVWPVAGHETRQAVYTPLTDFVIVVPIDDPTNCPFDAFANANLTIIKVPGYINTALAESKNSILQLTPGEAHRALLVRDGFNFDFLAKCRL